MQRVLVFLAGGFEEIEAITPIDYLRRAGIDVCTVSCADTLELSGSHEITVRADMTAAEALAVSVPDAVVVPGGMPGAANIASCAEALQLIKRVGEAGGVTAALCAAPAVVFAKLGLLAGKKYTCFPGKEASIPQYAGADWEKLTVGSVKRDEDVVVDGTLITGRAPGAAEAFSFALIEKLAGKAKAEEIRKGACAR
jgi:4-methyl-5(b-hydroxyethyl)-thiazole monophosphate biosynthesis